ncbi:hypothetical protein ACC743_38450, partial [Rhizobium ruizarguesonis]
LAGETGLDILPCITAMTDHPPFIYATGSDDTSIAVAALKAGSDDYMLKGISADYFDLLAAALEQALERAVHTGDGVDTHLRFVQRVDRQL